uniref:Uncharacterized protein n=1 Tax=Rhizophora mucronata TaxID=61149 RepID=A0A2P2N4K2_RHIMU
MVLFLGQSVFHDTILYSLLTSSVYKLALCQNESLGNISSFFVAVFDSRKPLPPTPNRPLGCFDG